MCANEGVKLQRSNLMPLKKKPMYRVYVVEDIDEDTKFWTQIGSAFAHEDKQGFNVLLKALPVDGKLVLRRYTDTKDNKKETASKKAA